MLLDLCNDLDIKPNLFLSWQIKSTHGHETCCFSRLDRILNLSEGWVRAQAFHSSEVLNLTSSHPVPRLRPSSCLPSVLFPPTLSSPFRSVNNPPSSTTFLTLFKQLILLYSFLAGNISMIIFHTLTPNIEGSQ